MRSNYTPLLCLIIYLSTALRSGINPYEQTTWIVEILTSFIPVLILIIMYMRGVRFSPLAYILMTILPVLHAIGAHYTFANVPSQWLSDLLHTDRNMYDRIVHASVWLYAFGIIELIDIKQLTTSRWLKISYALFAIMALAAGYELFERAYALLADPTSGTAILWSQWDIRDAQKDMFMDTIGAITSIIIYWITYKIHQYYLTQTDK